MKIPFFDYSRLFLDKGDEYMKIFSDVASRGAFIMQDDVDIFEKNLSIYSNSNYAIGVGNATDGLEISWMALNLRQGDEVICCSHTMLATASAIKVAGGIPIPVEIGDDNLIDPDAIEDAITSRTVGIMPTQLNGRTCDMERIMQIANKYKLYVVEDAAQALGSKFKGKNAGTFGHSSAISFFPAKVLGCFGDAGAILCQDETIFDRAYQLHDHGRDKNGDVKSWGRNSRLDNLQAAILNFNLKSYEKVIQRRREIASKYFSKLSILEELKLPESPIKNSDHFDVFQNYEIVAKRRDELQKHLRECGIGTLIQWGGKAIHQWEHLGFNLHLPKSEAFFKECIMIPMNMFISNEDIDYICQKIIEFYRK